MWPRRPCGAAWPGSSGSTRSGSSRTPGPTSSGYLFAYLGVRIGGSEVGAAVDALCEIPEAVYVIECTGHYDVLVEVIAKDSDDLLRLMHTEVRGVPGVTEVDTFMGLRIAKGTFRYTDLGRAGEARG